MANCPDSKNGGRTSPLSRGIYPRNFQFATLAKCFFAVKANLRILQNFCGFRSFQHSRVPVPE